MGSYYVQAVGNQVLGGGTGVQAAVVIPGFSYEVRVVGVGNYDFSVDANGDPAPSSIDVDVSGEVYTFQLARVDSVTIDPGDYAGSYSVDGQTYQAETATVVFDPGTYTLSVSGAGDILFDVDTFGNVTSQNPVAAVGGPNSLMINTTDVFVDPGDYVGSYVITAGSSVVLSPEGSGPQSAKVIPGFTFRVVLPWLTNVDFDVDAAGNVTSQNQLAVAGDGTTNTLQINTTEVVVDPGDYVGSYAIAAGTSVLTGGSVTGLQSTKVIPGLTYRLEFPFLATVHFDVDAAGNVTSQNQLAVTGDGTNNTLQVNTTEIVVDPRDYVGSYAINGGTSILMSSAGPGLQGVKVIPGFTYRVGFPWLGNVDFDVDAAGNVTSQNSVAIAGDGTTNTLQFITTEVFVDPGNYAGPYDVRGGTSVLIPYDTGPRSAKVIPGFTYKIATSVAYIVFDVDSAGSITSHNTAAAVGADTDADQIDETLRFNNVQIAIDPGDYAGTYYVEGGSLLPSTTGASGVIVVPGLDNYTITVPSVGNYDFNVDAAGDPAPSSIDVDVSGVVYPFLLSRVDTVTIDPGDYAGAYVVDGQTYQGQPATVEFDPGTYSLSLSGVGAILFDVDTFGNVTSQKPDAVVGGPNSLALNNVEITIDPVAYQGAYRILGGVSAEIASGVRHVVVVPDMQDYDLDPQGVGPHITFDVDAGGNVTSDRPTSMVGSGSVLTFENRTITIDPVAYQGAYRILGGVSAEIAGGARDVVVLPDMQGYDLDVRGLAPHLTFDVDAVGSVISNQPSSAVGSGSRLTFENRTITIDPGAYQGAYRILSGISSEIAGGARDVVVVPDMQGYDLDVRGLARMALST